MEAHLAITGRAVNYPLELKLVQRRESVPLSAQLLARIPGREVAFAHLITYPCACAEPVSSVPGVGDLFH